MVCVSLERSLVRRKLTAPSSWAFSSPPCLLRGGGSGTCLTARLCINEGTYYAQPFPSGSKRFFQGWPPHQVTTPGNLPCLQRARGGYLLGITTTQAFLISDFHFNSHKDAVASSCCQWFLFYKFVGGGGLSNGNLLH